jgi:tetratricopeptide (TPR) repeat protein
LIKGAIALKAGDHDKAMAAFQQAQKINPKNPAAHINIGALHAIKKKFPEAIKEYEEALALDSDRVDALGSMAQVYLLQGNPKGAFQRVEQQLGKTKNQAGVYQLLGQLSMGTKEYAKGIEYLEKAIDLNPELLSAYFLIGNAYAAQKKFDTAIEQYDKVAKKNPKAIQPLMMSGMLYDMQKQPQKANEYYQKVLDLNKNFGPAANNLAYNYAQHGGNLDVALNLAQRAREANPNDAGIADTLGWVQFKKGNYPSAISLLKESNENFKSQNATVLYHLAMAHDKNGEEKLAKEAVQKALALGQSFPEAAEAKKLYESLGGK